MPLGNRLRGAMAPGGLSQERNWRAGDQGRGKLRRLIADLTAADLFAAVKSSAFLDNATVFSHLRLHEKHFCRPLPFADSVRRKAGNGAGESWKT